jgi:hypothetical protein
MNDQRPSPPRDDAELAARIDAATRPAPWGPAERARFSAGVAERVAEPVRAWRWLALAGSLAAGAVGVALALRPPPAAPSPTPLAEAEVARAYATEAFLETYDEQVLFAPEWTDASVPALDGEAVPDDYRAAAALLAL